MQYLNRWWRQLRQCNNEQQYQQLQNQQQFQHQMISPLQLQKNGNNHVDVNESFFAMRNTNIMMPLDLLSDERNLYSIMPYCDGGELFERLDLNERFSENEARYWMDQVLNVSFWVISLGNWLENHLFSHSNTKRALSFYGVISFFSAFGCCVSNGSTCSKSCTGLA